MTDAIVLEDLPFDELRQRALSLAYKRHDVKFVFDLLAHSPGARAAAAEGGSLGDFTGSVADAVAAAEEVFGKESVGEAEPLYRARFATYLREHGGG